MKLGDNGEAFFVQEADNDQVRGAGGKGWLLVLRFEKGVSGTWSGRAGRGARCWRPAVWTVQPTEAPALGPEPGGLRAPRPPRRPGCRRVLAGPRGPRRRIALAQTLVQSTPGVPASSLRGLSSLISVQRVTGSLLFSLFKNL